jgi:predicted glycoside hydrolase/deacetylase ChbG (UPF0249 family)
MWGHPLRALASRAVLLDTGYLEVWPEGVQEGDEVRAGSVMSHPSHIDQYDHDPGKMVSARCPQCGVVVSGRTTLSVAAGMVEHVVIHGLAVVRERAES